MCVVVVEFDYVIIIIITPARCHGVSHRRATSRYRPLAFEMLGSKKVKQMILEWVPRPWPFMTDFTGRHIQFFGRSAPHWLRLIHRLPIIYTCVAVFCGPENSCLECVQPTDYYYYDDVPFILDEFMDVMRERIFFGYLDTVYGWLNQCHVRNGQ